MLLTRPRKSDFISYYSFTMNQARDAQKKQSVKGQGEEKKTLHERAFEKIDVNYEIHVLDEMIKELRIEYEQYFLGLFPYQPTKLHNQLKAQIRKLHKAPFKRQEHVFRIRALESRYNTYNDYWQRILRQKEEGSYSKDVFKAKLRERHRAEDQDALTLKGAAAKQMSVLFDSYKKALEKQTGKAHNLDFAAFQKSLLKRAQAHKEQHGNQKLTFKVVIKDGKVTIKARAKSNTPAPEKRPPAADPSTARSRPDQMRAKLEQKLKERNDKVAHEQTRKTPAPRPESRNFAEAKARADAEARARALLKMKKQKESGEETTLP